MRVRRVVGVLLVALATGGCGGPDGIANGQLRFGDCSQAPESTALPLEDDAVYVTSLSGDDDHARRLCELVRMRFDVRVARLPAIDAEPYATRGQLEEDVATELVDERFRTDALRDVTMLAVTDYDLSDPRPDGIDGTKDDHVGLEWIFFADEAHESGATAVLAMYTSRVMTHVDDDTMLALVAERVLARHRYGLRGDEGVLAPIRDVMGLDRMFGSTCDLRGQVEPRRRGELRCEFMDSATWRYAQQLRRIDADSWDEHCRAIRLAQADREEPATARALARRAGDIVDRLARTSPPGPYASGHARLLAAWQRSRDADPGRGVAAELEAANRAEEGAIEQLNDMAERHEGVRPFRAFVGAAHCASVTIVELARRDLAAVAREEARTWRGGSAAR